MYPIIQEKVTSYSLNLLIIQESYSYLATPSFKRKSPTILTCNFLHNYVQFFSFLWILRLEELLFQNSYLAQA